MTRYEQVLKHIEYCDRLNMWLPPAPELYLTDDECRQAAVETIHTYGWIRRQVRREATGGKLTQEGFKV